MLRHEIWADYRAWERSGQCDPDSSIADVPRAVICGRLGDQATGATGGIESVDIPAAIVPLAVQRFEITGG